jgi:hypothetical protein
MLLTILALTAVSFALWFTYMVRYPKKWEACVDALHQGLRPHGLSFHWMQRMEKGILLKILVAVATVLILSCVAVLFRHPTAWSDFLREYSQSRR